MIHLSGSRYLDEGELSFSFVRASGPGGQNVNKVSTAVELRFDVPASGALSDDEKQRLLVLAGRRATSAGIILIDARNFRTQEANRREAVRRLLELVGRAIAKPADRIRTELPASARERRRQQKKRRSGIKSDRSAIPEEEDREDEGP